MSTEANSRDAYPRGDILAQTTKTQASSRLLPSTFLSPRRSLPAAAVLAKPLRVIAPTVLWCGWLHWRTADDTYERRFGVVDVARQELHLYASASNQEPCFHKGDPSSGSVRNAGFLLPTASTVSLDISGISRAECLPPQDSNQYVAVMHALELEGNFSNRSTSVIGSSFSGNFSSMNFSSSRGGVRLGSESMHGKQSAPSSGECRVALFANAASAAACQAAVLHVADLPAHESRSLGEVVTYGARRSALVPTCRVPYGAVRWRGWVKVEPVSSNLSGTAGGSGAGPNTATTEVDTDIEASVAPGTPSLAVPMTSKRYAILVASLPGSAPGPALLLCESPPLLSEPLANTSTTSGAPKTGVNGNGRGLQRSRARTSSLTAELLDLIIPAAVVANSLPLGKFSTIIVYERTACSHGAQLKEAPLMVNEKMLSGPKDTEHNQEMGQRSDEEAEDVDGEHVQVRIAIKTRECGDASSAQASLVSSAGFTEVVDVKVLPRPSLPPNFTRRPSSLKLLPLSTALNEENSGSKTRFLSTEELRQRSEAAAAVSTELKGDGSANDFRREVVAVRTEAGCAWRTLPSTGESAHRGRSVSSSSSSGRVSNGSTDDGVLVSVSTGHRSLWRPASLSTELAACHEAASNAVKRLTALPPSAYEVTPDEKTSKANNDNSPCFLLVASECIQRLTVQANVSESTEIAASPSVVKASRRGNFLGASLGEKRRCDSADDKVKQESSSNEIKEELDTRNDEQVNNGDDNDYADGMDNEATKLVAQAAIVRVHRTIPLSDLQRAWTGGGDRTISSDDGKGGMDSSRKKQASDELRVGIECVVPARSRHASSHSARAFGWRKSGASARTGLMAAFRTSAHGNSGNGASCKDGDANSNSRHGSSSNNSKNSRFPMRNAPLMRKRTFYFITSNANELEADLNVRLDMSKLLQNFGNPRRIATRAASRAATIALPFSPSSLAREDLKSRKSRGSGESREGSGDGLTSTDTSAWAEAKAKDLRERFASALTFLYGPTDSTGNYLSSSNSSNSDNPKINSDNGELVVSDAVRDAIEAFSARAGDSLLQEVPGFLGDFVDYLIDRFWILAEVLNEDGTSSHSSSGGHGEEGRGSSLTRSLGLTAQEAEALKVQLHQLLVDTLVLPLLGDALWAQCLQTCQQQDDTFHAGVRAHRAFEATAAAAASTTASTVGLGTTDGTAVESAAALTSGRSILPPPAPPAPLPPAPSPSVEGGAAGLLAGRAVDWSAAAAALRRVERTLNPSDQLEAVRKAVAVLTSAQSVPTAANEANPSSTDSKAAASAAAAAAEAPLSADDLIPAFIEVVARAAATTSSNITELPPKSSNSSGSSNTSISGDSTHSGSIDDMLAFGLLSPASVVEWLRALVHPELLMMEPGFVLALLEGAVAFLADGGASAAAPGSMTRETECGEQHQTSETSSEAAPAAQASVHTSASGEAAVGSKGVTFAADSFLVKEGEAATSSPEAEAEDTASRLRQSSLSWRLSTPLSASLSQRPSSAVVAVERSMELSLRRSASAHWSSTARLRATMGGPVQRGGDGVPLDVDTAAPPTARPLSARTSDALLPGHSPPPRMLTWSPQALREAVAEVQAMTAGHGASEGGVATGEVNAGWRGEGQFGRTPEILRLSHAPAYEPGEALSTVRDSGGSGSSDEDDEGVRPYSSHSVDDSAPP